MVIADLVFNGSVDFNRFLLKDPYFLHEFGFQGEKGNLHLEHIVVFFMSFGHFCNGIDPLKTV